MRKRRDDATQPCCQHLDLSMGEGATPPRKKGRERRTDSERGATLRRRPRHTLHRTMMMIPPSQPRRHISPRRPVIDDVGTISRRFVLSPRSKQQAAPGHAEGREGTERERSTTNHDRCGVALCPHPHRHHACTLHSGDAVFSLLLSPHILLCAADRAQTRLERATPRQTNKKKRERERSIITVGGTVVAMLSIMGSPHVACWGECERPEVFFSDVQFVSATRRVQQAGTCEESSDALSSMAPGVGPKPRHDAGGDARSGRW